MRFKIPMLSVQHWGLWSGCGRCATITLDKLCFGKYWEQNHRNNSNGHSRGSRVYKRLFGGHRAQVTSPGLQRICSLFASFACHLASNRCGNDPQSNPSLRLANHRVLSDSKTHTFQTRRFMVWRFWFKQPNHAPL